MGKASSPCYRIFPDMAKIAPVFPVDGAAAVGIIHSMESKNPLRGGTFEWTLSDLESADFGFRPGDLVFLEGDLGAGKTAFVRAAMKRLVPGAPEVKSPTYVYFRTYAPNVFHFDLYRIESYDAFVNVGGEEILDREDAVCFVEWPERLEGRYRPSVTVRISRTGNPEVRRFEIVRTPGSESAGCPGVL